MRRRLIFERVVQRVEKKYVDIAWDEFNGGWCRLRDMLSHLHQRSKGVSANQRGLTLFLREKERRILRSDGPKMEDAGGGKSGSRYVKSDC